VRIGNLDGRLVILTADGVVDVERASGGRFGADPRAVYDRWAEFTAWAAESGAARAGSGAAAAEPFDVRSWTRPRRRRGSRSASG
jgi:2,4-didehydro-3-deoxy-L-rhamnonate hydrolase